MVVWCCFDSLGYGVKYIIGSNRGGFCHRFPRGSRILHIPTKHLDYSHEHSAGCLTLLFDSNDTSMGLLELLASNLRIRPPEESQAKGLMGAAVEESPGLQTQGLLNGGGWTYAIPVRISY